MRVAPSEDMPRVTADPPMPRDPHSTEEVWPEIDELRGDMDWAVLVKHIKTLKRKPTKDKAEVVSRCRAINSNLQAKQPLWKILVEIMTAHEKIENLKQASNDFKELEEKAIAKATLKENNVSDYAIPFAQLPEYDSICLFRRGTPFLLDDVNYLRASINEKESSHVKELKKLEIDLMELMCQGSESQVPTITTHSSDIRQLSHYI